MNASASSCVANAPSTEGSSPGSEITTYRGDAAGVVAGRSDMREQSVPSTREPGGAPIRTSGG
jgi:hypothetical protein